ncbi:hypothetical protein OBBRIDRAFT_805825 [Obba rivulosa]|uniref:Uncharacterized protein n=1 Tax=Obba rivulosa TaxID=1052685 RepID=A0A8E2DH47_9APHY|nr:hypothetical protein OBBRIDRAFT_805825 [Obba rivulosa]
MPDTKRHENEMRKEISRWGKVGEGGGSAQPAGKFRRALADAVDVDSSSDQPFTDMSYVILGRAVKSEYLAIGTILGTVGLSMLATGGSKKEAKPAPSTPLKQVVESAVPINASSKEEEELMNSIKKFIADAEKEH